jgi:hypothetical protein
MSRVSGFWNNTCVAILSLSELHKIPIEAKMEGEVVNIKVVITIEMIFSIT